MTFHEPGQENDEEILSQTPAAADDTPITADTPNDAPDDAPQAQEPTEPSDELIEAPGDPTEPSDDPVETPDEPTEAPDELADLVDAAPESAPADETPEPAIPNPSATDAKPPTRFSRGEVLKGVITSTTPTSVTVDLGDGAVGIIPGRELERMTRQLLDELKDGEEIPVYVVNPSDHEGNTLLSVNRALEELDWQEAEAYRQSQDAYEGKIAGYNKGGLIVRFGRLRGFVPKSQISEDRILDESGTPEEVYGKSVNEPIIVKVTEVDRSRNRLILSERAAMREHREKRKEELIGRLTVGQVTTGRVVSIEDFGAFVDIGGAEGLVHLTEISWKHINRPEEALKRGQEVKVEVISIDPERKRIGLSMKRQEADPWDEVASIYDVGQLVQGTITKLTKFGAFARLVDAPDIEGLVHISELSDQRVTHPREVVKEGEKLTLRVVKIDVKNRRLGLSLKRVNSAEYLDRDMQQYFAGGAGAPADDAPSATDDEIDETPPATDGDTDTE